MLYAVAPVLAQTLILSPLVLTTFLGGDAHFICTKDPSISQIAWNNPWNNPFIPNSFQTISMNFSELHFNVSDISMNNTALYCIGRNLSNPSKIYYSNPGLIMIQGINFRGCMCSNNNNAPL